MQYSHHRLSVEELENTDSINAFKSFEEEDHIKPFQCYIKLVDLTREALYAPDTPVIQN